MKSFLCNFCRHLAIFSGRTAPNIIYLKHSFAKEREGAILGPENGVGRKFFPVKFWPHYFLRISQRRMIKVDGIGLGQEVEPLLRGVLVFVQLNACVPRQREDVLRMDDSNVWTSRRVEESALWK